jgi:uncharacterized protein
MPKDIIVKISKTHKKGVFAARDFKKGEVVLKWHPLSLSKSTVKKVSPAQKHYVIKHGKKYLLMQAPEKFVNHSCEPNTKVKNDSDVAVRNIKKGEEITTDYGKEDGLTTFTCTCGHKNCRGLIGNK